MNKKIALALLLSTFSIGTIHVMDGNGQSGAFPPPYNQQQPDYVTQQPQQAWAYPVFVPVSGAYAPSASCSSTDSRLVTSKNTVHVHGNCNCVFGDNCCRCTSNGDDECSCPVSVSISPLVKAALNLFTCGGASADEDPSARQLREMQECNPGMKPAVALLAAGPRVVTKEHKE